MKTIQNCGGGGVAGGLVVSGGQPREAPNRRARRLRRNRCAPAPATQKQAAPRRSDRDGAAGTAGADLQDFRGGAVYDLLRQRRRAGAAHHPHRHLDLIDRELKPRAALLFALALGVVAPACYTGSARTYRGPASPSWRAIPRGSSCVTCRSSPSRPTTTAARRRWRWCCRATASRPPRARHRPELAQGDVRAGALRDAARARGLQAFVVSGTFDDLDRRRSGAGARCSSAWRSRWR